MIEDTGPNYDISLLVGPASETPITSPYLYALFAIEAILMLWGVQLSIQTRNVADAFNESRPLALTTFLIAFLVILIGPMQLYLVGSQDLHLLQFSFGALIGISFCVIVLFVPKIALALANPDATLSDIANKSGKTGTQRTRPSMKGKKATNESSKSGSLSHTEIVLPESGGSGCSKCLLRIFSRFNLDPNATKAVRDPATTDSEKNKSNGTHIPEEIRHALGLEDDFVYSSSDCNHCEKNVNIIERFVNYVRITPQNTHTT